MARLRALAVSALAGFVLSACSGIPSSGPIEQGPTVESTEQANAIRVIAPPPRSGMTPEQVVEGFLVASASAGDDYGVARQYLTTEASARWVPVTADVSDAAGMRLSRSCSGGACRESASAASGRTEVVRATGIEVGRIDASGHYTTIVPRSRVRHDFRLVQDAGNWRISSPPKGLVLTVADVERGYRNHSVYFLDPERRVLVPDVRWFPLGRSSQPVTAVRALLAGPSQWLAPAVRTAFPPGTSLSRDSVPVQDGVETVDLSPEALGADDSQRRAMAAQLTWTLTRLGDVAGVVITVSGQPYQVPGAAALNVAIFVLN